MASRPPLRTLALVLAALLAPWQPARAADPVVINVVLPLTGGGSFLGQQEQASLQRAEAVIAEAGGIGGRPVKFAFHDDQSSPQVAVQLATRLIAAKPNVILGSGLVGMCNAMAPLMRRGPVMYCFSPGVYPEPGSFMFSSGVSTKDLAAALLTYWQARGITRIGVVTSTDASGQDALRNIQELAAKPEFAGITLVEQQRFNPSDVSAAAQIERIKAANPQAVIAWSTGSAVGTLFKAITAAGLDVPVATTNGNMTYAQMQAFAAFLPRELYVPSAEWPQHAGRTLPAGVEDAQARFFGAFKEGGPKPDASSTFSWDPAMLVVAALRDVGADAAPEALRDRLARTAGFAGVNGIYDMARLPQRGLDLDSVVVTRWDAQAGTWVVVSKPRGAPAG